MDEGLATTYHKADWRFFVTRGVFPAGRAEFLPGLQWRRREFRARSSARTRYESSPAAFRCGTASPNAARLQIFVAGRKRWRQEAPRLPAGKRFRCATEKRQALFPPDRPANGASAFRCLPGFFPSRFLASDFFECFRPALCLITVRPGNVR